MNKKELVRYLLVGIGIVLSWIPTRIFASDGNMVTLFYNNGTEISCTMEEMHAATDNTVVLLRDSCLDSFGGCDMSDVYSVLDFAVMNNAAKAAIPLTEMQYETIENVWLHDDYFEQLYPTVNQNAFCVYPSSDGRYIIDFGFNSFVNDGEDHDESMAARIMQGRSKAMEIIGNIPENCIDQYKIIEYLYNYVTCHISYYDTDRHGCNYFSSGREVCLLYDALIGNETVCAGFAYSFAYLCELAGIDAQYVTTWTGNPEDGSHEIVIAEVDGKNYWFDATWDVGNNQSGFAFFGLSDQELRNRHKYSSTYYDRYLYPECSSSLQSPSGYWNFENMTYCYYNGTVSGMPVINDEYAVDAGDYYITTALDDNMVLEVDGYSTENGGNAQIYYNGFIAFQRFTVEKNACGCVFRNCGSGLVLDVEWGYAFSGNNVWQYESNGTAAQTWILEYAGDGYYYIRSSLGDLYLEVADSSTANCSNVRVSSFTGSGNQKWRFWSCI